VCVFLDIRHGWKLNDVGLLLRQGISGSFVLSLIWSTGDHTPSRPTTSANIHDRNVIILEYIRDYILCVYDQSASLWSLYIIHSKVMIYAFPYNYTEQNCTTVVAGTSTLIWYTCSCKGVMMRIILTCKWTKLVSYSFFSERVINVWNSLPDSALSCVLIFLNSSDVSRIFMCLLLYYYLRILGVMIRLPLVLVWAWYMSCSQTVPLYCLQCICIDIIWANKMMMMMIMIMNLYPLFWLPLLRYPECLLTLRIQYKTADLGRRRQSRQWELGNVYNLLNI